MPLPTAFVTANCSALTTATASQAFILNPFTIHTCSIAMWGRTDIFHSFTAAPIQRGKGNDALSLPHLQHSTTVWEIQVAPLLHHQICTLIRETSAAV